MLVSPIQLQLIRMFNSMSKRSTESPMDWEWQTQGPSDPTSPFPQFRTAQGQKRGFEPSQPASTFGAPSSTPAPQFRNPSFTTPRKPFDPDLFSEASGVESSPGDNADIEDTPELPKSTKAMTAFSNDSSVKQPIFGRYGAGFLGSSPGRAEQRRGKYGNSIVNKIRKRKRIDRDYTLIKGTRGDSDSESDGESRPRSRGKYMKEGANSQGWFSSMLNGIESRPNLPNILSYYAQLSLNFFLAGITIYGIWSFWVTIQSDVNRAAELETAMVVAEMNKCAKDYVDNGCAKLSRPPALEAACDSWDHCMHRDPNSVGRAKISAHTFAQIFNSFIEPISYKAMIFVVLIVTVCILVNNLAFGMFRSKSPHLTTAPQYFAPHPTPSQNFQWGAPPQTPQHNIGYDDYTGTPFQQIMPSQTPRERSPSKESRSPSKGNRSPSKGDRY